MVVGHQPTLGQVAALALTGKAADWSIKKGAAWWIESRDVADVITHAVIEPDLVYQPGNEQWAMSHELSAVTHRSSLIAHSR